jgi:hypothetical protein
LAEKPSGGRSRVDEDRGEGVAAMISKAELEELYREDDRLRAEHRAWMARRAPSASPPVRETDDASIIYRTVDNNAMAAAPQPEDAAINGHDDEEPEAFERAFNELQMDTLAYVINELREEWRRDHAVEIAKLAAKLDVVLQLLGKSFTVRDLRATDVIDLPRGFIRRRHGSAA